jgi:hypothetical protein
MVKSMRRGKHTDYRPERSGVASDAWRLKEGGAAYGVAALQPGGSEVGAVAQGLDGLDRNVRDAIDRVLPVARTPLRGALLARALNALAQITPQLSEEALAHAIGARSDAGVLAHMLEAAPVVSVLKHDDPLAAARLRGLRVKQELIEAEGGAWSAGEVAAHLGLTRQAVDNRRRAGRLIGLEVGRRGFRYPVWQFDATGVLAGLELVLEVMTVRAPWSQASFFLSGDPRLGGERPLDALRHGRVADVQRAARGYGEHGAA